MPNPQERPVEVTLDDVLKMEVKDFRRKDADLRAVKMEASFQVMTRYNTLEGGREGDYLVVLEDAETGDTHLSTMQSALFEEVYVEVEETKRKKGRSS